MGKLNQNTIMNLNLEPGSIDTHAEALADMKGIRADGGMAQHEIIKQRVRNSSPGTSEGNNFGKISNSDEMYTHIVNMKKSGMLPSMLRRAGVKKSYLLEDEGGMAAGAGAMGGVSAGTSMSGSEAQIPMGGVGATVLQKKPTYTELNEDAISKIDKRISEIIKRKG